MNRIDLRRRLGGALGCCMLAAFLALPATEAAAAPQSKSYHAVLQELNGSGVNGVAMLSIEDDVLTVRIQAEGLEADKTHAQHIHGHNTSKRGTTRPNARNATCPTEAADADGDGIVSVGEGVPAYGPVLLGLTPFTTAPGGVIDFVAEYDWPIGDLAPNEDALNPLQKRAIILHGLTLGGTYVGSTPVACGQIEAFDDD
jgi:hypothetical protein